MNTRVTPRPAILNMSLDELRQHAETLQRQVETPSSLDRTLSEQLRHASQDAQQAQLKASRELSFYWLVLHKIGEKLKVDGPPDTNSSPEVDWRNYAYAVRDHVLSHKLMPAVPVL